MITQFAVLQVLASFHLLIWITQGGKPHKFLIYNINEMFYTFNYILYFNIYLFEFNVFKT